MQPAIKWASYFSFLKFPSNSEPILPSWEIGHWSILWASCQLMTAWWPNPHKEISVAWSVLMTSVTWWSPRLQTNCDLSLPLCILVDKNCFKNIEFQLYKYIPTYTHTYLWFFNIFCCALLARLCFSFKSTISLLNTVHNSFC